MTNESLNKSRFVIPAKLALDLIAGRESKFFKRIMLAHSMLVNSSTWAAQPKLFSVER